MFEKDLVLRGKHATYMTDLNRTGVFKRYIDVYMVGAIWGLLYNVKSDRDTSSSDDATIYAAAFNTERLRCEFIYRLVMLLDESSRLTPEQRIDRAFRYDDTHVEVMKENMDLFHSYVYGGIEKLYEKFVGGCTTREDYIDKINEVLGAFKDDIDDSPSGTMLQSLL